MERKDQTHLSTKTDIPCRLRGSSAASHDTYETSDAPTSTCLCSQMRKACAMSTFQPSDKLSRIQTFSPRPVPDLLWLKKTSPSSFLYANLPRPAVVYPAFFTPSFWRPLSTLRVCLSSLPRLFLGTSPDTAPSSLLPSVETRNFHLGSLTCPSDNCCVTCSSLRRSALRLLVKTHACGYVPLSKSGKHDWLHVSVLCQLSHGAQHSCLVHSNELLQNAYMIRFLQFADSFAVHRYIQKGFKGR